jgi:hypothetical protein
MIYQLNNTFSDGKGLELINPFWKIAGAYDNFKNESCQVFIELWLEGATIHHRHIVDFTYTNDEWSNQDVINAVLALPEFTNSIKI